MCQVDLLTLLTEENCKLQTQNGQILTSLCYYEQKADQNCRIMTLETCFNPLPHNPDF